MEAAPVPNPSEEPAFDVLGEPFLRSVDKEAPRPKLPVGVADALGTLVVVLLMEMSESVKWLAVYPLSQWRHLVATEVARGPAPGTDVQARLRRLARNAARAEVSQDGRLSLPRHLAARCGIGRQVTCYPRLDRLEIEAGNTLPEGPDDPKDLALLSEFMVPLR
jgi:DNA-binding transcriptional regulator/RsmH inhibitor MraZ